MKVVEVVEVDISQILLGYPVEVVEVVEARWKQWKLRFSDIYGIPCGSRGTGGSSGSS